MDDVPTLARQGVTGVGDLPNDAATTWPSGVRSTPSRETRKVEFLNARSSTTAVYWVDFGRTSTHYVDLPPGMRVADGQRLRRTAGWRGTWRARAPLPCSPCSSRADSTQNSNARLTDQERPRSFAVVDAVDRGAELGKTYRRLSARWDAERDPAPAPAEPEMPENQHGAGEGTDRHAIGRSSRCGGERSVEPEGNANPADAARTRKPSFRPTFDITPDSDHFRLQSGPRRMGPSWPHFELNHFWFPNNEYVAQTIT